MFVEALWKVWRDPIHASPDRLSERNESCDLTPSSALDSDPQDSDVEGRI